MNWAWFGTEGEVHEVLDAHLLNYAEESRHVNAKLTLAAYLDPDADPFPDGGEAMRVRMSSKKGHCEKIGKSDPS